MMMSMGDFSAEGRTTAPRRPPKDLHVLIFSKNRACQLDSLLRSIRDHFRVPCATITVLYRATTAAFEAGYEALIKRRTLEDIAWRAEICFSDDVRDIVGSLDDGSLIMFFVDDTVLFRPCNLDAVLEAFSDRHLFVSLRTSKAYRADDPPDFITDGPFLEWKWNYSRRKWVTWNYPFSVDGNIFHVNHLKKVIDKISFQAPNSFEGRMHTYRHAWWIKRIKRALAPMDAVVFNNPLNRVQAEGETWHENVTPESLNDAYCNGYHLDNGPLYAARPQATHFGVPVSFAKDAPA
jgi:hypothetical protein